MKKLFIALLLLGTAGLALDWLVIGRDDPGTRVMFDRVWIDRVPRGETDVIQVLAVLHDKHMGVFQRTSRWKGEHEIFRHETRGDGKLRLLFPQTREREDVAYRAGKCNRDGFDYCLEIRGASRGTRSYVSKKGWEIGSLAEAERKIESLSAP